MKEIRFSPSALFLALLYFIVLDKERLLEIRLKEKYERYKERTRRWF